MSIFLCLFLCRYSFNVRPNMYSTLDFSSSLQYEFKNQGSRMKGGEGLKTGLGNTPQGFAYNFFSFNVSFLSTSWNNIVQTTKATGCTSFFSPTSSMSQIRIEPSPHTTSSLMFLLRSAMFLATLILLVGFRHAIRVSALMCLLSLLSTAG